jgi:hypothetical protein
MSKLNGSINWMDLSFENNKIKKSNLGLKKFNIFSRNNKSIVLDNISKRAEIFPMFINGFGID